MRRFCVRAAGRAPPPRCGALALTFGDELEPERARDRRCLDELYLDAVAEPVGLAGAIADHGVALFVVAVIVRPDRRGRHEAVGAGLGELDEQPGPGDAGDPALEGRADPVGEVMGDEPVDRLALRRHRPALGDRDARPDLRELVEAGVRRQSVGSELQRR